MLLKAFAVVVFVVVVFVVAVAKWRKDDSKDVASTELRSVLQVANANSNASTNANANANTMRMPMQ